MLGVGTAEFEAKSPGCSLSGWDQIDSFKGLPEVGSFEDEAASSVNLPTPRFSNQLDSDIKHQGTD